MSVNRSGENLFPSNKGSSRFKVPGLGRAALEGLSPPLNLESRRRALEGSRFIRWQDLRVGAKEPFNRCRKNVRAGGSRERLLMCHCRKSS
jgi:hypothetical protein